MSLITRGDIISGTKKSERTTGFMPVNDSGATPMTVNGTPLIRTLRPRTPASDPNSFSHNVRPSTTTASRPGTSSSSALNVRPMAGSTPISGSRLLLAIMPSVSLGVAAGSLANPTVRFENAARPAKLVLRSRMST